MTDMVKIYNIPINPLMNSLIICTYMQNPKLFRCFECGSFKTSKISKYFHHVKNHSVNEHEDGNISMINLFEKV